MFEPPRQGRVVTFYSYKGGTGRSMALANVAWILAAAGKRVLMIDWDLEAPGLHRYFRPFLIDNELSASEGLVELLDRYATEAIRPVGVDTERADWWWPLSDFSEHVLSIDFAGFPSGGRIDLLPAGRQGDAYAVKVSAFNWQNFYERLGGGGFLDAVRARAQAAYDYVLIDSRTGVSDTAGICTAQMPDTLVVGFTYNNQSIRGAAAVAASARRLRTRSLDELGQQAAAAGAPSAFPLQCPLHRPYRVLPVPMRVDTGESDRLALRQAFARDSFASLLDHVDADAIPAYWSAVEVPHRVYYAYEEVLAPFKDDAHDPKTVLAAFVRLTHHITEGEVGHYRLPLSPEQRQRVLDGFALTPQTEQAREEHARIERETETQALVRRADEALLSLPEPQRARARSVICRLVRLGREEEGGGVLPIRIALDEIDEADRDVVRLLEQRSLVIVQDGGVTSVINPRDHHLPARTLSLQPRLAGDWSTLKRWLAEDRDFLLWRQQLRDYCKDWVRSGDRSALLAGSLLGEARLWERRRSADLNAREREFIAQSIEAAERAPPSAAARSQDPLAELDDDRATNGEAARAPAILVAPAPAAAPKAAARSARHVWPSVIVTGVALLGLVAAWRGCSSQSASERSASTAQRQGAAWTTQAPVHEAARAGEVATQAAAAAVAAASTSVEAAADAARSARIAVTAETPRRATTAPPPSAADSLALAESLYASDQFREAAAASRRALEVEPTNVWAQLQLGRSLERMGDLGAAAAAYDAAIRLLPDDPQPLIERAAILAQQRSFDLAKADLDKALELDPRHALAYYNRGAVKANMKDVKGAIGDYGQAVTWQQDLTPAYIERARLTENNQRAAAIADYWTVLALSTDAQTLRAAQERLRALGQGQQVVDYLQSGAARVAILYSATDKARAEVIEKALRGPLAKHGIHVLPSKAVSPRSAGDVRYSDRKDAQLAAEVRRSTQLALAGSGYARALTVTLREPTEPALARSGLVEIWLPPLTQTPQVRSVGYRPVVEEPLASPKK